MQDVEGFAIFDFPPEQAFDRDLMDVGPLLDHLNVLRVLSFRAPL